MMELTTAYIGLGSNLQDPISQLQQGLAALSKLPHSILIRHSSFYHNPPYGPIADQPYFVNAVAVIQTGLSAEELLEHLQLLEYQQGRIRTQHWGPRIIDLDILLYGNLITTSPQLTVPHPGISQRNFVLYPLAEIAPDLCLPTGISLQNLLLNCPRGDLTILPPSPTAD